MCELLLVSFPRHPVKQVDLPLLLLMAVDEATPPLHQPFHALRPPVRVQWVRKGNARSPTREECQALMYASLSAWKACDAVVGEEKCEGEYRLVEATVASTPFSASET